ncbi:MAG: hypothetical protein HC887_01740 [Desulfobacteraceae bacterium]|nr:hypothetical protein [Desulfobacteraceae bacterium]
MTETDTIGNIFEKTLKGSNILIHGTLMNEVRVVRVGISVNDIGISSQPSEYIVDSDLWFRFKGQFENTDIEFTHSIQPVDMGTPIREYTADDITTRIYHIKAVFRAMPDYRTYPLDKQLLTIGFRHRSETRDRLIFVSDPAPSSEIFGKPAAPSLPTFGKGWKTEEISFYTDVITNFSTLGSPKYFNTSHTIVYSRFNAEISAERNDPRCCVSIFFAIVFIFYLPVSHPLYPTAQVLPAFIGIADYLYCNHYILFKFFFIRFLQNILCMRIMLFLLFSLLSF